MISARQRGYWAEIAKPAGVAGTSLVPAARVVEHLDDFYNIAPNLLLASDAKFERFFEKLYELDRYALMFYILKHADEITGEQMGFAKEYFASRPVNGEIDWAKAEKIARAL